MTPAIAPRSVQGTSTDDQWCIDSPDIDILENDKEFLVIADIPGASVDQISVKLENSLLSISADVPDPSGYKTSYRRQLKLAIPVDAEGIQATVSVGELTLHLPKAESHRAKRIEVRAA